MTHSLNIIDSRRQRRGADLGRARAGEGVRQADRLILNTVKGKGATLPSRPAHILLSRLRSSGMGDLRIRSRSGCS
ncbi:MAG: hypothetical protein ACLSDM_02905 [Butyricicoccus sp.]